MRLRITRQVSGSLDGIQLNQFEVGQLYDVGTAVGSYLLAIGAAEPVAEEGPLVVPPLVRWEAGERRLVPPGTRRRRTK
jgi:hypothetical protein